MKKTILLMLAAAATSLTTVSSAQTAAEPAIIPKPVSVKMENGAPFQFENRAMIFDGGNSTLKPIAEYLAAISKNAISFTISEETVFTRTPSGCIWLRIDPSLTTNDEGYKLEVTAQAVRITGKTAHGVFNGVQTFLQLLPPEILSRASDAIYQVLPIPAMTISDEPRFAWRGMMLDCGRYFHSVADIKKLLDVMAMLKLNTFHWHLTEDQGWRLAINQYPLLTSVGSWRSGSPEHGNRNKSDNKRYGGFYTQQDAKEIVAYAAQRFITVVPEIEIPGHAAGAITAYPQLGNTDVTSYKYGGVDYRSYKPEVNTHWGVLPYIFAPKPETFTFLENVLTEVMAIFPSTYIHIGGDEAPTVQWDHSKFAQDFMKQHGLKNGHQIEAYFTKRISEFLTQHGRKLIGWDEIEEGGLPANSAVMVWHGFNYAMNAINAGHDVVIGNTSNLYFDYAQAKGPNEPETIGGMISLKSVYDFDPMPPGAKTPEQQKHVLGVQGQLWSEYLWDWKKVEYNAFPRACALAEIAWTPQSEKNYGDFITRLKSFVKRLDILDANYRHLDAQTPLQ